METNSGLYIFMTVLSYIGAVGIAIFSFPEVIRCFRTKKTSSVNVWLFALLATSSAFFWISGFYTVAYNIYHNTSWAYNLAVAIANVFSFSAPVIILSYRLYHVIMAKKLKMTEKEFEIFKLQQIQNKQMPKKIKKSRMSNN